MSSNRSDLKVTLEQEESLVQKSGRSTTSILRLLRDIRLTLSEVEAAQQSLDKSKHNDPELMYISLQLHQWAVTRAFLQ